METEKIKLLFEKFEKTKILVIGDAILDAYSFGKVERISPEGPIPILQVEKKENRMGGAANVVLNLQALGAKVFLATVIGEDSYGEEFLDLMRQKNLSTEGVLQLKNRKTTCKTRFIAQSQQLLRADWEDLGELETEQEQKLIQNIKMICKKEKIDLMIFEDYNKGVLTENLISELLSFAKEKNIFTTVDPKKKHFFAYKHVHIFKPNFKELCEGLGKNIDKQNAQKEDFLQLIVALEEKIHPQMILLTLSELGVLIKEKENFFHIPAHFRAIVDVSGAGDTVIAVASLCLLAGCSAEEIAKFANLAGGLVCEKVGVVALEKNNFEQALMAL